MIETRRLQNVAIFFETILSFVLSRKIIHIYNDIARTYGNVRIKDFRRYEKLEYKKNKLKLDIDFLNNCKQLGMCLKFLIFKLLNVSNKDAVSICKTLLRSTINKRKIYNIAQQEVAAKIVMYSTKRVIFTHEGFAAYLYSQLTTLLLISCNMNYLRKNLIYLKQVYTFQSNQIKFDNPKSSLPLKRPIVPLSTILNPRKPNVR